MFVDKILIKSPGGGDLVELFAVDPEKFPQSAQLADHWDAVVVMHDDCALYSSVDDRDGASTEQVDSSGGVIVACADCLEKEAKGCGRAPFCRRPPHLIWFGPEQEAPRILFLNAYHLQDRWIAALKKLADKTLQRSSGS